MGLEAYWNRGARPVAKFLGLAGGIVLGVVLGFSQSKPAPAKLMPVSSAAGPAATFTVADQQLHKPLTIIAYGDMRFTDPDNVKATNPGVRQALIGRITEENPDAVLLNGDVPWHGGVQADYSVYQAETQPWRDAHLRVYPALGNHEFGQCDVQQCLENWWRAFPELQGRRWYSVQLGTQVRALALDSDTSLLPHSDQAQWLESEFASLAPGIRFVLITMHHPPVADVQTKLFVDHNPRANEIALADFLEASGRTKAKIVVIAGHIHNYERFEQNGVVYLVSGGGGAVPYPVERTPPDAYQDSSFPNYHYVKFVLEGNTLKGTMIRLTDPRSPQWEIKDAFEVHANR